MFNFSGSELVFLLLLALIILGPEKLPEAIRKFGQTYAEFKKVTTGFQTELKQALDEPVKEMRQTAELFKQAATFDVLDPKQTVVPAPQQQAAATAATSDAAATAAAAPETDTGAAPPLATAAGATAEADDAPKKVTGETVQRMRSLDDVIVRQPFGQAMTTSPRPAATESATELAATAGDVASDAATTDAVASDASSAEPAESTGSATSDVTTTAADDGTTRA